MGRAQLRRLIAAAAGAAPSADAGKPILDRTVFDQVHAILSEERLAALRDGLLEDGGALIADLPGRGDPLPGELAPRLHALAGTAATLGARALQAALAGAEHAVRCGERDAMARAFAPLPALWQMTAAEIASRRRPE